MEQIQLELLKQIADLDKMPTGAFNLRVDGALAKRNSTAEIEIVTKKDKPGIDIIIKPNTVGKSVHIPVLLTKTGLNDLVYNDFYVGENCDVTIVAGCGIYNCGTQKSEHDGVHSFHIGKNSKVRYVEKHLGIGEQNSDKVLNPTTKVEMQDGSEMKMETTQIGGVTTASRKTEAKLFGSSKLVIEEKILTTETQTATTNFVVKLLGKNSRVEVLSRSVAKGNSFQKFKSTVIGKNQCFGHVECDGIIVDNGKISSLPEVRAEHIDSTLTHEASIGKIAGEQIAKLQTLGLSQKEAEQVIIDSFMLE